MHRNMALVWPAVVCVCVCVMYSFRATRACMYIHACSCNEAIRQGSNAQCMTHVVTTASPFLVFLITAATALARPSLWRLGSSTFVAGTWT